MKRSWIPAALMGALGVGYLAGSGGYGSRDESPPKAYDAPDAPPSVAAPSPLREQPEPSLPRSVPIPDKPADDGLGEYPAWNGIDLDCPDIGHPVRVTGPDPHRLDHDGNGVGCEGQ